MKKKILLVFMTLLAVFGMRAQGFPGGPQASQLPLNPKVRHGVLENGLNYFILHNEEPKERADFYIAQKVGSTLEQQDQLGLAHFLEHMAFNGTKNYPGKNMLNYLQSKGIRFGADINAYTAFDETVYNINNVVTTDQNLMDSVLLVLHDWSGDILLEDAEIDAERGVIQEEWRSRNSAQIRMYTDILPKIYQEYQYQQMPIGKMDVVMNFKPEVLRAYYKKWYRPDQQGIIIVGDIDVDAMEKKVIDLFSTIPMPENAAPREYPSVSDNEKPIYVSYTDPELTNMMTTISFKSEPLPAEVKNTLPGYIQEGVVFPLISTMINNRLNDFGQSPECKFAYAGVNFGDFYVSKTKASFDVRVLAKNNSQEAVEDAMGVVARACKAGFNETEFERAKDELMANMEKAYGEKDKTSNQRHASELINYFVNNEPSPGIETEYQLWQMLLPQLPLEAINQAVKELLTDENMVVVTSAPKGEGFEIVSEEAMLGTLDKVMHAEYEALEEEKITEPLIPTLATPGTIVSDTTDPKLDAQVLKLSNGVKVVLKTTDFAGDEVLMYAFREGGKQIYEASQAPNVLMMEDVYENSKFGNFDSKTLKKYLAGKNVSLDFSVNTYTDVLNGNSTVKDLPTLFELIYTSFTNLNPDTVTYNVTVDKIRPMLENAEKNPQTIFFKHVTQASYDNNPLVQSVTPAILDEMNYDETFGLVRDALGNPADYTFVFVGNITPEVINPLLEQYLASLPTKETVAPVVKTRFNKAEGQVVDEFKQPMETPTTMVYDIYGQGGMPYTLQNDIMVDLLGGILRNIFIETLREEEGGTYSPSAVAQYDADSQEWNIIYVFLTNADQQAKMIARADEELMKLLNNGTDLSNFNKAKEAMIKQYEINSKKNRYVTGQIVDQLRFPEANVVQGYGEALQGVTLDHLNDFMKTLYNGQNRIQVIMEGVSAN